MMLLRIYNIIVKSECVIDVFFYFDGRITISNLSLCFVFGCRMHLNNCGNWLILAESFLHLNQIFGRKWGGKVRTHQQILGV